MKRILFVLSALLLVFTCGVLSSCKGPINDEQAREILEELLPEDAMLNSYIWGESFKTAEDPGEDAENNVIKYYLIKSDMPYQSVSQLRDAALEVYSEEMMGIINSYAFENNDTTSARFCNALDDDGNVIGIKMDITANHEPYRLTAVAQLDTVVVKRSSHTVIEAELQYRSEGREGLRDMTVKLIKEDGVWKLDSQTWIIGVE